MTMARRCCRGWARRATARRGCIDQAVAVVAREGKASTSFIQRHLNIGYNRAAKLIEQMEKEGVVGPANHVGKREVLVRRMAGGGGLGRPWAAAGLLGFVSLARLAGCCLGGRDKSAAGGTGGYGWCAGSVSLRRFAKQCCRA